MNNSNARVARTKGYLKEALIELLKTIPFENITIKAICQKAAVNRSTFYSYYSCPRDLIEEIEADILSKLPDYDPEDHKPFIDSISSFMQYIKENGDTFQVLLFSSADTSFGEQITSAVMAKYDEFATLSDQDDKEMSFIFIINGVVGVVREWIAGGFRWSVEKISNLIVDMSFGSIGINPNNAYRKKNTLHM